MGQAAFPGPCRMGKPAFDLPGLRCFESEALLEAWGPTAPQEPCRCDRQGPREMESDLRKEKAVPSWWVSFKRIPFRLQGMRHGVRPPKKTYIPCRGSP